RSPVFFWTRVRVCVMIRRSDSLQSVPRRGPRTDAAFCPGRFAMFRHLNLAIARIVRLDEELRKDTFPSQDELAAKFGVSRRTVQRAFDLLREHKAPIKYDPYRRGFHYSDPTFRLSFVRLSAEEAVAVFLAQRLLDAYGGTPFAAGINSLFQRCLALCSGE